MNTKEAKQRLIYIRQRLLEIKSERESLVDERKKIREALAKK